MPPLDESTIEEAALAWFGELGYAVGHGPEVAPGEAAVERVSFGAVVLEGRLQKALRRLNPGIPAEALEDALRQVLRVGTPSLTQTNRAFHRLVRDGVDVEYARPDGSTKHDKVWLIDFRDAEANDWLVVNQFTVIEGQHNRRPDIVVFVNGLPLGLVELKNAADADATIWSAYAQLQTYQVEVPSLLHYNAVLVVSDGVQARIGSLSANQEWFKVWRTIDGSGDAPKTAVELEVLVRGVFDPRRFLDLLQHFIVFEENPDTGALHKVIAGYHQFHAVNAAVEETVRASGMDDGTLTPLADGAFWSGRMRGGKPGDRRAGVVWHTQGSGKSFSMLFYAARVIRHPAMRNPTLVVLTDRNDLDDQLFGQFQRCHEILGQTPVQAPSREQLRTLLAVASGGVVFTTIQKFLSEKGERLPALSDRRNIIVIADEAHRSQYDLIDGLARHMRDALPNASFIGFTGTPIEKTDANTRAVFGDYISIYDIQRAVADHATVPIYYESRIAKLGLNASELPKIDAEFEAITEGEEPTRKEQLKTKWAAVEALVGDPKRIALVAADLVDHFEKRLEAMDGKAMVVCMSRRICVDLYNALIRLRPNWTSASDDDAESEKGRPCVVKVVMTGSAEDGPAWQPHIRNKEKRRHLANRFKDSRDPFRIVIVRDMWLTGFDAPCLHTMYADKPMQGHGLMQAIARVNRVFRDKPGGLVVDYLGLADQLKHALANYTESGGKGDPTYDTRQAIAVLLEKHGIACAMLHGFHWKKWTTGKPAERLALIPAGQEHILQQADGKPRFVQVVTELSRAFALCAASDEATAIRDDVAFFQALQSALNKQAGGGTKTPEQLDAAVRQLVSRAIVTDGQVIDVFTAAGLPKPDISILDDRFLAEVRGLKHKNVAVELLEKLLRDELRVRGQCQLFFTSPCLTICVTAVRPLPHQGVTKARRQRMDIINKETRRELISALRERYRLADRQAKGRILDEFVEVSGLHRKHAVRLFRMKASAASKDAPEGRRVYDEATRQALIVIWEAADRICGKRLKAIIPDLLTAMEKHGHVKLEAEVRQRVESASAATIDRLLRSVRKSAGSRRRKRPGKRMAREIPVKTCHDWHDPQPGYLEIDFVVHSGGSMAGEYLHSLVATDVCSGWTEAIPLIAREQSLVVEGLRRIGNRMPMPIIGIDSDNDGAFINETLASYCREERITLTRSRVHQKNDQAWIEQKNGAVIRRMVGHDRLSGIVAGQVLAQLLEAVRLYVNFFQPSFKLRERVRDGAKIKRFYHPPATPCDRLLAHPAVSLERKESLRTQRAPLDPVGLLHRIRRGQSALAALSKGEPGDAPVQDDLREFLSQLPDMWRSGEVRPTHRKGPSKARHWRTREDPFALVWPDILVWLQADPDCTAKSLMARIIERYPDSQHASHLRTLHRRIAEWRSTMARSLMLPGTADRQGFTPVSGTPSTTLGEFPLRLATLASAPTPPALAGPNMTVNR